MYSLELGPSKVIPSRRTRTLTNNVSTVAFARSVQWVTAVLCLSHESRCSRDYALHLQCRAYGM